MLPHMLRAASGNAGGGGIPTDGLIAHYTMDNISGSTLVDEQGSYDGTISGAVTTTGAIGNALSFDGVNDVVTIPDATDFSFGNGSSDTPFSLSVWVSFGSNSGTHSVLSKDGFGASDREWDLTLFSGVLRFLMKDNGGGSQQSVDANFSFTTNTFYHIIVTYDGSGGANAADGISLYIDDSTISLTNIIKQTYTAMANTASALLIGKYFSNYSSMKVDAARIYKNKVLSAEERSALFNEV